MPIDFTLDIAHALASPEVVSAIESMVRQAVRAEIGDALASGQLLDVPAAAARLGSPKLHYARRWSEARSRVCALGAECASLCANCTPG